LDASTGETRWRVGRPARSSWTSPIALPGQGRRKTAVLLQSPSYVTAHDVQTGDELWRFAEAAAGITSSVFRDGWLLVPMRGLTALRLSDESQAPAVAWDANRLRPGNPSPLIHDGRVYVISNANVRCGDAKTGELLWAVRLKGNHWATPVLAGGHLYCVNQDGDMQVVKVGDKEGIVLAENRFGETIHASPAVAGNALYVRSDKHLWKIAK
jgi:outer membrane protein assembly factor BamB